MSSPKKRTVVYHRGMAPDGRLLRGEQTRLAILDRAARLASAEGLEGLSIGRLATELSVSKSGLFAHFGSKEELQVATVAHAAEIFRRVVVRPAFEVPPGVGRVRAIYQEWLGYSKRRVFPGGCFFAAAGLEFDTRPGRVRDEIAAAIQTWWRAQVRVITDAVQLGELPADTDPEQLAFELDALVTAANANSLLHDDDTAYTRAERAVLSRIGLVGAAS